jgi:hypothetical protein
MQKPSSPLSVTLTKIYLKVLSRKDGVDIVMIFSLALMDHFNPGVVDTVISMGKPESILLFLVSVMYSPENGLFQGIPTIMASLQTSHDSLALAQSFTSNILQPYIASIANIISRVFVAVRHSQGLLLGLDMYILP